MPITDRLRSAENERHESFRMSLEADARFGYCAAQAVWRVTARLLRWVKSGHRRVLRCVKITLGIARDTEAVISTAAFTSLIIMKISRPQAPSLSHLASTMLSAMAVSLGALLMPVAATAADTPAATPGSSTTQGNWLIRLRGTYLDMAGKSDPVGGVGASDRITVNNKWIPEVDVTYFFTRHIAAELMLTIPQKQDVYLDGNKIGSFRHLPPSLLLQYHFIPEGTWRPYVGAGINATRIYDAEIAGGTMSLDSWSVGPVLQVGVDYRLTRNWFLNADVKKAWLSSDVKAAGAKISQAKLDPWLFSVGVGYRF